jgi:RNA polymerase sigma factor (sigma-70 family)
MVALLMTSLPTVFLVDDDAGVRDALSLSLKTAGLNVETYDAAEPFLAAYSRDRPGCLVLDVRMPQMSGPELQETLKANGVKIPIIFITGHGDIPMSVKAIKEGAIDFLEKPFRMQVLLERVQEAMLKDAQARESDTDKQAIIERYALLTPREREILSLIIAGKSSKEIAKELHVSPRTIETHRSRIIDKMKAKSLSDLLAMAFSCGLNQLT